MGVWGPNSAPTPAVVVTAATQQMSVNTKYIANRAASRAVLKLPTLAAVGDQIFVRGLGSGGWKIEQNAGQQITGASNSTAGTSGYIQSQTASDTVALECLVANTTFQIISNRGTLDIN